MSAPRGPIVRNGARWWLRADVDPDASLPWLEATRASVAGGLYVDRKSGRRKSLFEIPSESDSTSVGWLWKRNRHAGTVRWRRLFGASKSRHELQLAAMLATRGVPCVVPLAAAEERTRGMLNACHLVVAYVDGATDLLRLSLAPHVTPATRRGLATELGHLARAAFDAGLCNDDFTPNNVLVVPVAPRLRLIDFERARIRRRPAPARWRVAMLAKLARALPDASASDRMRCVLALVGSDRLAARALWHAVDAGVRKLARRDHTRAVRVVTREGRRLGAVTLPSVTGIARREIDIDALEALVTAGGTSTATALVLALDDDVTAGRRVFAWSHAIAARGLGLRPIALLHRGDRTHLVLDRATGVGDRLVDPASRRPDAAALRVLLRRLEGLATLDPATPRDAVSLATTPRGGVRAIVRDPRWLRPCARWLRADAAAIRARAAAILERPAAISRAPHD